MKKLMYVFSALMCLGLCIAPASGQTPSRYLYGPLFLHDGDRGANSCIVLDNQGDKPAECAIAYYSRDGRLIKAVDKLAINPKETVTRFVAKDLVLGAGKAQGSFEVCVKSGEVAGKMAFFLYQGKSVACYLPLQGISRTSLVCRCFNEVEVNGDGMVNEAGEVKTDIALKNPNASQAKYKYTIYDSDGKSKLKEGAGTVPGHGLVVFSPRAALKGDARTNLKVKGSVSFEVSEGSLVGHACVFNSDTASLEVLKDTVNQQVKAMDKPGAL